MNAVASPVSLFFVPTVAIMPRRRNGVARTRAMLALPAPEPAAPPDPYQRDQAPVRYGSQGCRWCGGKVIKPRRTFCSDGCIHQFRLRSSATYRRQAAFIQQGPLCQACGVDTREIGLALRTDPERARREYGLGRSRTSRPRRLQGSVFDLDHTLAVAHGGGGCDLNGLRILCPACHAGVTWATRPRRGKKPSNPESVSSLEAQSASPAGSA